jgi:hypothetical protein
MASLQKPKAQPEKAVVQEKPPETPEEKRIRERKESRRHLRVKFKPEDQLVTVKWITREAGEDDGLGGNLVRDAHSAVSEGLMFKQHKELDRDDDDGREAEEDLQPYTVPIRKLHGYNATIS